MAKQALEQGIATIELLQKTGLCDSAGAAKRLIKGGGCRRNGEKISDILDQTDHSHLSENGVIKLSAGKKHHALVLCDS